LDLEAESLQSLQETLFGSLRVEAVEVITRVNPLKSNHLLEVAGHPRATLLNAGTARPTHAPRPPAQKDQI